jgi:flagellar hook assembly protein FlgD
MIIFILSDTNTIEFSLPQSGFVTLQIYNILGKEVTTLVSEQLSAGSYKYDWDAGSLASGVYLYRIQAGDFMVVRKMVLMK